MKHLFNKKNVVGYAKGEKWTNNKNTGRKALLVFVEKKEPLENLDPKDVIDKEIDGVETDVVGKTGKIEPLTSLQPHMRVKYLSTRRSITRMRHTNLFSIPYVNPRARHRPIIGGTSIGHGDITAGTIGGVFLDKDGDIVGLSNNHVLANSNLASTGDKIYQPGPADRSPIPTNVAGMLKSYKEISERVNQDSAIMKLNSAYSLSINMRGMIAGFAPVSMYQTVFKSGRTTGSTVGMVIGTDGEFQVGFGGGRVYTITECIVTTGMAAGGDSGSLLLDGMNRVVGLLFAGSETTTIHSDIKTVRDQYGLKIPPSPIRDIFAIQDNMVAL